MEDRRNRTLLDKILHILPLLIALGAILSLWFSQVYGLSALKESVLSHHKEYKEYVEPTLRMHDKELAVLEKTLADMSENLKDIKNAMKR